MSKHTPGPWSVKNDYDERHIVIANIDGESFPDGTTSYTYDFVCDTYGGDYESVSRAVANANARLIAAAPELLAELKRLSLAYVSLMKTGRDRIVALGGDCDPVDVMERGNPWLRSAKEVIAKAEGR